MLNIKVNHLSKRYNFQPVIHDFNFCFQSKQKYAVKGQNGTGKSTLIHLLCGYLSPSSGEIIYSDNGIEIVRKQVFKYLSISSPYCTLIDDFSLIENYNYYKKFKSLQIDCNYRGLLELLEWKDPKDKPYEKFSSGMRQKASVLFSFLADTSLLFLDEPTSYMDSSAKQWYKENFIKFNQNKLVIIASNDETDFIDVNEIIELGKK
jgi:ABC-type multidrug transport system ATPase subunit